MCSEPAKPIAQPVEPTSAIVHLACVKVTPLHLDYWFRYSKQRTKQTMTVREAIDKGYLQKRDYATVRGQLVPLLVVPVEGWRQRTKPYRKMDMFKGRWSEARIAAYLEAVRNPFHDYWRKYRVG